MSPKVLLRPDLTSVFLTQKSHLPLYISTQMPYKHLQIHVFEMECIIFLKRKKERKIGSSSRASYPELTLLLRSLM